MERKLNTQVKEEVADDADLTMDRTNEPGGDVMLPLILASLDDDKAQDVISLDLRGKTSMTDDMVICSGRSQRHVGALADHVLRKIKEAGFGRARVEGLPHCDWVLIDAGDVVVHIFRPEVRDFYRLERMWATDLPAEVTSDVAPDAIIEVAADPDDEQAG